MIASHRSLRSCAFCHARRCTSTAGDDAGGPPEAGLAARVAAGPGLWEDGEWLADLRRESLLESLLASRGDRRKAAGAGHRHKLERALNAAGHGAVPGHRGAVPGPGLRRGPRPGIRHAGRRCQARHPGADRPGLLQGAGTVRRGPRPGHVRGRRGPGRRSRGPGRDRVRPGNRPDGTTWNCSMTRCSRTRSAPLPPPRSRCCAWSGSCTRAPAAGKPPSSSGSSTGRTPWPTGCRHVRPGAARTSPTAASSRWTAGSGSPAPARTWPGA